METSTDFLTDDSSIVSGFTKAEFL